jgi:NAD(P)-dependent dehydrogenase (short-subunit alcohol dehydrogenase family)
VPPPVDRPCNALSHESERRRRNRHHGRDRLRAGHRGRGSGRGKARQDKARQGKARQGKVDILVNNASIARSETPAENAAGEHWPNVVDVNLNGTFWRCRAFGAAITCGRAGADPPRRAEIGAALSRLLPVSRG